MAEELWICPLADICEAKITNFKHCVPHTKGGGCLSPGCAHPGIATCILYLSLENPDWEV